MPSRTATSTRSAPRKRVAAKQSPPADGAKGLPRDVGRYLATVAENKRADSAALIELMSDITGERPRMRGTIVGFGDYHYRYASGHEGDSCLAGFSPRKAAFSIYLTGTYFPEMSDERDRLLARLGKHTIGKSCLYVKRLSDIDLDVLRELVALSVRKLREHYAR
jgi:hypothetical protein